MEIDISYDGSAKFYDEALSVVYNRKKLINNPKKKLYGLSFNAAVLAIVSLIIVAMLKILSIIDGRRYYGYISIIFIFTMAYGAVYYFKVQNRISELKNQQTANRLIIENGIVALGHECMFHVSCKSMLSHWIALTFMNIFLILKAPYKWK